MVSVTAQAQEGGSPTCVLFVWSPSRGSPKRPAPSRAPPPAPPTGSDLRGHFQVGAPPPTEGLLPCLPSIASRTLPPAVCAWRCEALAADCRRRRHAPRPRKRRRRSPSAHHRRRERRRARAADGLVRRRRGGP